MVLLRNEIINQKYESKTIKKYKENVYIYSSVKIIYLKLRNIDASYIPVNNTKNL